MTILDQVFSGKAGGDLLFSAGVEVGRVRGREEFAQMLIREFPKQERGRDLSFPEFVRIVLVKIQRGDV